jgi:hypothetical protein
MKDIFKYIINEFIERELPDIKKRDMDIPLYSNKIISLIGIRRSGKTYLLYDLIKRLRKKISRENIIYINFEDDRLFGIKLNNLNEMIEAYFEMFPSKRSEKIYLFLDEIQEVEHWEKFVRRIYDTVDASIFITGSSSKLLGKEISTSLRGRTLSFEVFPLSFQEFLRFRGVKINLHSLKSLSFIKNSLDEYLKFGGFVEIISEDDVRIKHRILQDYIDLITGEKEVSDEFIKELPMFYLGCIKALSDIPESITKYFSHEIIFKFWAYIRDKVNIIYLSQPDFKPVNSFTFKGKTYYMPEELTKNGIKYPFGNETLMTFVESADLLLAGKNLKEGKFENINLILGILAREKGEVYDEKRALEKAEMFNDLSLEVAWSVFFYLLQQWTVFASGIPSYLVAEASLN